MLNGAKHNIGIWSNGSGSLSTRNRRNKGRRAKGGGNRRRRDADWNIITYRNDTRN